MNDDIPALIARVRELGSATIDEHSEEFAALEAAMAELVGCRATLRSSDNVACEARAEADAAEDECERLRAENERLREVLAWYADEANYDSDHAPGTHEPNVPRDYSGWDADCGERARAALEAAGTTEHGRLARKCERCDDAEVGDLRDRLSLFASFVCDGCGCATQVCDGVTEAPLCCDCLAVDEGFEDEPEYPAACISVGLRALCGRRLIDGGEVK